MKHSERFSLSAESFTLFTAEIVRSKCHLTTNTQISQIKSFAFCSPFVLITLRTISWRYVSKAPRLWFPGRLPCIYVQSCRIFCWYLPRKRLLNHTYRHVYSGPVNCQHIWPRFSCWITITEDRGTPSIFNRKWSKIISQWFFSFLPLPFPRHANDRMYGCDSQICGVQPSDRPRLPITS